MGGMLRAVDVESWQISPGLLAPPLVSVSGAWEQSGARVTCLELAGVGADLVRSWLEGGDSLVGANIAYDLAVLCAYDEALLPLVFRAYAVGRIHDVRIRQELLDIATGRTREGLVLRGREWVRPDYSLAGLEALYLGIDRSGQKAGDVWRLHYDALADVPVDWWPASARDYALADATGTLAVYLAQAGAESGLLKDEAAQCRAAWALHLQSCWGIRTDGPRVQALKEALEAEQTKNHARLRRAGLYKPAGPKKDPTRKWSKDMAAIRAAVTKAYARQGKVPPKTDKGSVATDKDTLNQSGSRVLALLADGGGVDKILTTYIPALVQGAERPVNVRYHVLKNTGRTSSSGTKGVGGLKEGFNIQNLPTGRRVGGVRECIIFRPGTVGCSVDYNIAELRGLAQVNLWLFGWSKMADAIKDGKDPHLMVAAQLLGVSYADVVARYEAGDPAAIRARDCGKVANFGFMGGLGAATFVEYARAGYGIILTEDEARDLKAKWLETWPEMVLYFRYISDLVGMDVATITQFISGRVRGGVGYTDGCNGYVQGLIADGAKAALFDVAYECYVPPEDRPADRSPENDDLYGCRPVAFIHDEVIAELPVWKRTRAARRLTAVWIAGLARYLPDVPVTAEPALMFRWWKKAKPVWRDGELEAWEPDIRTAA